jgi:hypothetical protein
VANFSHSLHTKLIAGFSECLYMPSITGVCTCPRQRPAVVTQALAILAIGIVVARFGWLTHNLFAEAKR